MASLPPSTGGGGMVSVEAPCRISMNGQSSAGGAPAAAVAAVGCGCFDAPKKVSVLSESDGAGGVGGTAAAVAGAGAEAGVPTPNEPPLHPARRHATANHNAIGARPRDVIRSGLDNISPTHDARTFISGEPWPSEGGILTSPAPGRPDASAAWLMRFTFSIWCFRAGGHKANGPARRR